MINLRLNKLKLRSKKILALMNMIPIMSMIGRLKPNSEKIDFKKKKN